MKNMSEPDANKEEKPEFSVRIVVCDHYLNKPTPGIDVVYSDFRGADIKQVPVLRIFGPTHDGHKACLHVHGVFPYFYLPCPTSNPQPQFLYQIAASLDKALNIALKQATSTNQHVYKISLVKGLPGLIKQAVELCSNGAIMGQTFQPHESHLNFTLQFFIDFNLFGMSNIDLQFVKFRKTGISQSSKETSNEFDLKPESGCHYEADCFASHIMNRQRIGKGDGIENPGLEEVWNQEIERRKQLNMSIASKSLSQGRIKAEETDSHYKFEQMFLIKMIDKSEIVEKDIKFTEIIQYPAESKEGSQLFDAVDVSVHVPDIRLGVNDNFRKSLDMTVTEGINDTLVDEDLAFNSSHSLHYSQVLLNNEDLELVDMLQDMEEKSIEEDSVMSTPANVEKDNDSNDIEYSQVFNEETIYLNQDGSEGGSSQSSSAWNDSFWDGANLTQLDGTCDNEHVKKVRKRKMRGFKLGLAKPKPKKNDKNKSNVQMASKMDTGEIDEINVSREIVQDITDSHLRNTVKLEPDNKINKIAETRVVTKSLDNGSIEQLVDKVTKNNTHYQLRAAKNYDLQKNFEPIAGPSKVVPENSDDQLVNNIVTDLESSPEDNNLGIMSFYDISKVFDMSIDNDSPDKHNISRKIKDEQAELTVNEENENLKKEIISAVATKDTIRRLTPRIKPPSKSYIFSSLQQYNIPKVKYSEPYYSDHKDVGDKVEIGQMVLKLHSKLCRDQKPYENVLGGASIEEWRQLLFLHTNQTSQEYMRPDVLKSLLAGNRKYVLMPVKKPPTREQVEKWLENNKTDSEINIVDKKKLTKNLDELDDSQALGLNEINNSISLESNDQEKCHLNNSLQISMQPDGSFLCFGNKDKNLDSSSIENIVVDVNYLTLMLTEVHVSVRGELQPDPTIDPIQAIFFTVTNDCPSDNFLERNITEILIVDDNGSPKHLDRCVFRMNITYVENENTLLQYLIEQVRKHDPDILCGYEIEINSWGYIMERAQVLGLDIVKDISRITEKYRQKRWRSDENDFEGRIIGRIMLNVWRLFRHELALSSYSFENCIYQILKERVPKYSYSQLCAWWNNESKILRWIPVEYYLTKLSGTVRMLDKLDIINRTSELARLFGLQWWEVLSRGSQFRVESLMLRAARPLNLVALSPTIKQRAAMRAPECLPLIFEPESRFYTDPVIVLDFQSLYPSMMIAYNYCFSTCIGRVQNINRDTAYEFGAWRLRISKSKLETLVKQGLIHWSPVGVGFVKASVRRGVLPALLRRILAARQAVKKNMKMQTDETVKKAMHSRQLGLKLIANVTYGYTAANFSGRMPCVEVGDSVVSKGRETLERAIKLVRENTQWNVKVIYGDTDSMFVLVPGGTRADAFHIGQQIADAVTADNPSPVALKLEKVYQPCILQTKKRYVGYMYECPEQEKPVYEAKGIETVRRDGCPAGVKLLQQALCELFETGDMSRVKRLVMSTLTQLADGTLPVDDLFFTREYHGPAGYRPGASAPPNEIAKRILSHDRRAAPRPGERVSWLVTAGAPSAALVKLARTPAEVLREPSLQPHKSYYAARVLLPPLHRCLSLLGVDVFKWWSEVGRTREVQREAPRAGGIARYMWRERCAVCGAKSASAAVCGRCAAAARSQRSAATLAARTARADTYLQYCNTICTSCTGHVNVGSCENTECPVLWRRLTAEQKHSQMRDVGQHLPPQFTKASLEF